MERTLSGATILRENEPESDSNKEVLRIPQSSSITTAILSDCLVSYTGHSLEESYLWRNTVNIFCRHSRLGCDC